MAPDDLTGYEEHLRDEGTREEYMREAYGDPCPNHHNVLRYGGDCGYCMADDDDMPHGVYPPAAPPAERAVLATDPADVSIDDDDIPF